MARWFGLRDGRVTAIMATFGVLFVIGFTLMLVWVNDSGDGVSSSDGAGGGGGGGATPTPPELGNDAELTGVPLAGVDFLTGAVSDPAFLGDRVPLHVLQVLPGTDAVYTDDFSRPEDRPVVHLSGRTALTVVFSRSVIALGADWGPDGAPEQRPFTLVSNGNEEVPGRLRWVTTSIARFDPTVDWPSDLELELVVNAELRSHDDSRLVPRTVAQALAEGGSNGGESSPLAGWNPTAPADGPSPPSPPQFIEPTNNPYRFPFRTSGQSMNVWGAISPHTLELTGGLWDSGLGLTYPDVPPDGQLRVVFSRPVNSTMLKTALQIEDAEAPSSTNGPTIDTLVPCPSSPDRCVIFNLTEPMAAERQYRIVLPAGARYHELSGPLGSTLRETVTGLVPFRLPVVQSYQRDNMDYKRYHLWLRYGLAADVSVDDLAAALRLSTSSNSNVPFTLRLDGPARAVLECEQLDSLTEYTLHVSGGSAVRDGYGQPLVADEVVLSTAAFPTVMSHGGTAYYSRDTLYMEPSFNSSWAVVERGWKTPPYTGAREAQYKAYAVSSTNLNDAVARLLWPYHQRPLSSSALEMTVTSARSGDDSLHVHETDAQALFGSSGLFLSETGQVGSSSVPSVRLSDRTHLAVTTVYSGSPTSYYAFWVTDRRTAVPLQGATVSIYGRSHFSGTFHQDMQLSIVDDTHLLGRVTADANGMAVFDADSPVHRAVASNSYVVAIVEHEDASVSNAQPQFSVLTSLPGWSRYRPTEHPVTWQATVAADRGLYRLNETVHLVGHVLAFDRRSGDYASIADVVDGGSTDDGSDDSLVRLRARVYVSWASGKQSDTFDVDVDSLDGRFSAELTVPMDADFGDRSVSVALQPAAAQFRAEGQLPSSFTQVTVADPRLPTVEMELTAVEPAIYQPPVGPVQFELQTETMSGSPVEASVTLRWSVQRGEGHHDWAGSSRYRPQTVEGVGLINGEARFNERAAAAVEETGVGAIVSGELGGAESDALAGDLLDNGELTVDTSSAQGKAIVDLVLPGEAGVLDGDTITVTAEWLGPARELLRQQVSVPVQAALWTLAVSLDDTVSAGQDPLPGYPFGVGVELHDSDGSVVALSEASALVAVELFTWDGTSEWATDGTPPAGSLPVVGQLCADVAAAGGCDLTLPSMGRFAVRVLTTDPTGAAVATVMPLGRTQAEWIKEPLHDLRPLSFAVDGGWGPFEPESELTVRFTSPFAQAQALLFWGNQLATAQRFVALPTVGEHSITVQLGNECVTGCTMVLAVAVPRQDAETAALPVAVPMSPLLDLGVPRSVVMSRMISVHSRRLEMDVDVNVDNAVAAPGSSTGFTVSLRDSESGLPVGGRAAVWVVDRALLQLKSVPLPDVAADLAVDLRVPMGANSEVLGSISSKTAYDASLAILRRRLEAEPWLRGQSRWNLNPADAWWWRSDEEVIDALYSPLTLFPSQWRMDVASGDDVLSDGGGGGGVGGGGGDSGMVTMAAMTAGGSSSSSTGGDFEAPPQMGAPESDGGDSAEDEDTPDRAGDPGAGSGGSSSGPTVRDDIRALAMFEASVVVDGETGEAHVDYQLPDNVGSYEVRVVAVGDGHRYGAASTEQVARLPLNLQASVPRVVRVGDQFTAGVTVNLAEASLFGSSVELTVSVAEPSQENGGGGSGSGSGSTFFGVSPVDLVAGAESSVTVQLDDTTPQEVLFSFESIRYGDAEIVVTATVVGNEAVSDALRLELASRGQMMPVSIATSFAVPGQPANSTGGWTEGLAFPQAEPGSGSLWLGAGVGRLPAVLGSTNRTMAAMYQQRYFSGSTTLVATMPEAVLGRYGDGVSSHEQAVAAEAAAVARVHLSSRLHDSYLGLKWSELTQRYNYGQQTRPSAYLNALGLFVDWRVRAMGAAEVASSTIRTQWHTAMETSMRLSMADARRYSSYSSRYSDMRTIALMRMVKGPTWVFPGVSADWAYDVSMERLVGTLNRTDTYVKAATALSYLYADPSGAPVNNAVVRGIVDYLESSVRVQARTAYFSVSLGAGSPMAADAETTALALMVLVRAGGNGVLAEKVANYLAMGQPDSSDPWGGGYARYRGTVAEAMVAMALAEYDESRGSTEPDLRLTVMSQPSSQNNLQGTLLLDHVFDSSAVPVQSREYDWLELVPSDPFAVPEPLEFLAVGTGEASVVLGMDFVPQKRFDEPVYRGIFVEKMIQRVDPVSGEATGAQVTEAVPGQVVRVTIQLTSPDSLGRVHLVDLLPGGLEAIDDNLDNAALLSGGSGSGNGGGSGGVSMGGGSTGNFDGGMAMASGFGGSTGGIAFRRGGDNVEAEAEVEVEEMRMAPPKPVRTVVDEELVDGVIEKTIRLVDDSGADVSAAAVRDMREQRSMPFAGDSSRGGTSFDYPCFWCWNYNWQRETKFDRVEFVSRWLRAGTHTVSYDAIVVTSGQFGVPPTLVEAVMQPELMGMSASGDLTVVARQD